MRLQQGLERTSLYFSAPKTHAYISLSLYFTIKGQTIMTDGDVRKIHANISYIHDKGDIRVFLRHGRHDVIVEICQQVEGTHMNGNARMKFKNLSALIETLQEIQDDWHAATEDALWKHIQSVHKSIWDNP